jgi:hypothetical protein
MKKQLLWRRAAVLASAAVLAGTVAAVAPAASVAKAAVKTCPNKRLKITNEGRTISIPVKAITTEGGVSCATAYKVIAGGFEGKMVDGYKTGIGKFEAPEGLVPEIATKGSKKIKFAVQGG